MRFLCLTGFPHPPWRPLAYFLALLALFSFCVQAKAQRRSAWGPRTGDSVESRAAAYRWVAVPQEPDQHALYLGTKQMGAWSAQGKFYRPIDGDEWGEVCEPPHAPPPPPTREDRLRKVGVEQNFGIDESKLTGGGYRISGRPASRTQVFQALEKGLPNDTGKFRLTIIGTDEERFPVEKDWAVRADDFKDVWARSLVWSVPADHWSVQEFSTRGKPTIYLQAPDGKVLHRQDDYQGPKDFEAIRKAISDYDAAKDPDRRKTTAPSTQVPPTAWGLGGLILLALALKIMKR